MTPMIRQELAQEPVMYKRCTCCRLLKQRDGFHRLISAKDGRQSWCILCRKTHDRQTKEQHPEKVKAWKRKWSRNNPHKGRERYYKRMREEPEKMRARGAVTNAVYKGKIKKPDACMDCRRKVKRNVLMGHHEDYSKPLDVIWVCSPCHWQRHKTP